MTARQLMAGSRMKDWATQDAAFQREGRVDDAHGQQREARAGVRCQPASRREQEDSLFLTSLFAAALHTITDCLQTGSVTQNLGTESKKAQGDPQADAGEENSGRNSLDGTHVDSPDPPVELPLGIIVIRTCTRRLDPKKFASHGCS